MEGAAVFAWKGHDLLPAGSAAADSRGRINPGSHPARAVTFSQPCHCDQGVALRKIKRNIAIILRQKMRLQAICCFCKDNCSHYGIKLIDFPSETGPGRTKSKPLV